MWSHIKTTTGLILGGLILLFMFILYGMCPLWIGKITAWFNRRFFQPVPLDRKP